MQIMKTDFIWSLATMCIEFFGFIEALIHSVNSMFVKEHQYFIYELRVQYVTMRFDCGKNGESHVIRGPTFKT